MQEIIKKRTKQIGIDVILLINQFPNSIATRAISNQIIEVQLQLEQIIELLVVQNQRLILLINSKSLKKKLTKLSIGWKF